jgi:hypothetical protein
MMRSRHRFFAALAALAAMLFAQAAFALAACDTGKMPSRAQVLAQGEEHAPCHEPAENVNLCLAHCQNAEQTLAARCPVVRVGAARAVPGGRTSAAHPVPLPPYLIVPA